MAHALLPLFPCGVLSTGVNPDTFRICVDGNILGSGKKKLRIKKYSDTCGRALFCTMIVKPFQLFKLKSVLNLYCLIKRISHFCECRSATVCLRLNKHLVKMKF